MMLGLFEWRAYGKRFAPIDDDLFAFATFTLSYVIFIE
tara:strand:- start:8065 stop:8178 length:114 start_codon:yes stop_codon:yes gene_type:complete